MRLQRLAPIVVPFIVTAALHAQDVLPRDHHELTRSTSYPAMEKFLKSVDGKGPVSVSIAGKTTKGRNLYLVRLSRGGTPSWKVLFYAQQHGDEISGKDALLYLIRDIAANPELLPRDTEVWMIPMMNPDGAEAGTRVSGAGVDLNRDHMTLAQPETQALHRVVQRVRPDVAVDCHEFGRDGESWRKKGWEKWPDITMDRLNNPLFDPALFTAAEKWMDAAFDAQKKAGHPFLRYWVGGVPPEEEQRHSAPDIDSAMNAIGTYGGLSFIMEAAARDGDGAIAKELGNRVDAYLVLLRLFIDPSINRSAAIDAIRVARTRPPPAFIPTNYLWVNVRGEVTQFPVRALADGSTIDVATPNLMKEVAVKRSVTAPAAYAIDSRVAEQFAALLERQAIPYEKLSAPRSIASEKCTLLLLEEEFDEVYSRYGGRQIVRCDPAAAQEIEAGALLVPLSGDSAIRAALLLEPQSLYGLYQYPAWRTLVNEDGTLPVRRVVR